MRTRPDVAEHQGRVFDAIPSQDDRSLDYPIRPLLGPVGAVTRVRKCWRRGPVLDQGQEGACVGHGVVGELTSTPVRVDFTVQNTLNVDRTSPDPADGIPRTAQDAAFWVYRRAQRIDEWPGEEYSGTSLNAGLKVVRNQGLIDGWRWLSSRADLVETLITTGPVLLAIPWHTGMYDAPGGELRIEGTKVGWHCILANGYDPSHDGDGTLANGGGRDMIRLLNSWGTSWGSYGSAWVETDALWPHIESNGGDMAVALGRTLTS